MELKTWATGGFERFECVWKFDDFWKRSNTFHAFLCFVDAAERNWPGDPEVENMSSLRKKMIDTNSTYFDGIIGGEWVWSDDYGWCGISCLAAYDYLRRVGDEDRASDYLARAERCWEQMREVGYDATDKARPVPHGCGNISPQRKITEGGYGTKNTVTNTNLLVLSLRLYNAVKGTDPTRAARYLSMAYAQYQWFSTWFLDKYQSEDDGYYLRLLPGPNALIHERPVAKPDYLNKDFPTWEPGWVWTGDQGLLMAGLAELLPVRDDLLAWTSQNQVPDFDPGEFENSIRDVLLALTEGIMILFSPDNVLREPPFSSSFGSAYGLDYVGGRGVLLRYVSEKSVQQVWGRRFHPPSIAATAEAVWNSRDSENQFGALWNKANDGAFNKMFVNWWGSGDSNAIVWDFGINPPLDKVHGVLQGLGLDALTAAMRYNLP
ncbi:MAG TPA: glycoside hydrolase family 76 protein [Pyrinomonadaceae bacterium]